MASLKLLLVFFIAFFLASCEMRPNVDEFIQEYDTTDFSMFKNSSIHLRGKFDNDVYIVSNLADGSHYFIEFEDGKILNMRITEPAKNSLNEDEIKRLLNRFENYGFYTLVCDDKNNVIINPFYLGGGPYFLRVGKESGQEVIRLYNNVFIHYKGRWYISTTYMDENKNIKD